MTATNDDDAPKHRAGGRLVILTPARRKWLYGVLIAAVPLLIVYGVIEDAQAPLWIALVGAVLGNATAAAHTPRERTPPDAGQ